MAKSLILEDVSPIERCISVRRGAGGCWSPLGGRWETLGADFFFAIDSPLSIFTRFGAREALGGGALGTRKKDTIFLVPPAACKKDPKIFVPPAAR